jgi:predicted peptidase
METRRMQRNLKKMTTLFALLAGMLMPIASSFAGEELVTTATTKSGATVPYVLNDVNPTPRYVLILFPGGLGVVDPHMENGQLVYQAKGNFLLRARQYIVDDEFATVATNSTSSEEQIQALIDDLKSRFPQAKIYLMGTSRGTTDTMALAEYLQDKIAGEIHTSSMQRIAYFDGKKYQNRQLVVHHRNDSCRNTPVTAAQLSHDRYGTELILMEGGISVGNPCEPFAYHGYNGIEKETSDAIKQWIKQAH